MFILKLLWSGDVVLLEWAITAFFDICAWCYTSLTMFWLKTVHQTKFIIFAINDNYPYMSPLSSPTHTPIHACFLLCLSSITLSLQISDFLKPFHPLTWKTSGWPGCGADGCWTCCSLELERWWGCWPCHCGQTPTPSAVRVWNCPAVCPVSGASEEE